MQVNNPITPPDVSSLKKSSSTAPVSPPTSTTPPPTVPSSKPESFEKGKLPPELTSPKVVEIALQRAQEKGPEKVSENLENLNRGFWSKVGRSIAQSGFGKFLGLDKLITKMYDKANGGLQVPKDAIVTKVANPGKKMLFNQATQIYPNDDKSGQPIQVKKGQHAIVTKIPGKPGMVQVQLYEYNKDKELELKETGFVERRKLSHHWQKRTHTKLDKNLAIFPHQPKASDIGQGAIGNCFLLAGLGAMVDRNPKIVENLIKDNGDGTVTVKMFDVKKDEQGKPILVDGKKQFSEKYIQMDKSILNTSLAIRQHAKNEDSIPWVALLEKAYTIHLGSYAVANEGGHSDDVFEAFLGQDTQNIQVNPKNESAREQWMKKFFESHNLQGKEKEQMTAFSRQFSDDISKLKAMGSTREDIVQLLEKNEGLQITGALLSEFKKDMQNDEDLGQALSLKVSAVLMKAIANKTFATREELEKAINDLDLSVVGNSELESKIKSDFLAKVPDSGLSKELKALVLKRVDDSKLFETDGKVGSGEYSDKSLKLYEKLSGFMQEQKLLAFGTTSKVGDSTGSGMSAGEEVSHGLVGGHAYNIVGIVELKPGDKDYPGPKDGPPLKFVQIRNPWNTHEGLEKVANVVGLAPDGGFKYEWNDKTKQLDRKAMNQGVSLMELSEFSRFAENIYAL